MKSSFQSFLSAWNASKTPFLRRSKRKQPLGAPCKKGPRGFPRGKPLFCGRQFGISALKRGFPKVFEGYPKVLFALRECAALYLDAAAGGRNKTSVQMHRKFCMEQWHRTRRVSAKAYAIHARPRKRQPEIMIPQMPLAARAAQCLHFLRAPAEKYPDRRW